MTCATLEYMEDINTSEEPLYKLLLEGEGITLSREIPRDAALAVINVVLGGAVLPAALAQGARSAAPSSAGATTAGEGTTDETPGEYIETVGARTNVDKIVAFGAYLHDARAQQHFSRDDIKAMFRAAHETPPANYPRDFRAALTSRGIAEESPDRYFVTRTGRSMIEQGFSAPRASRRGRRQAVSSTDAEA
jgi:hypothetical protein